jgi:hypothetical protein
VGGKEHYDRALAIYDPAKHRPVTTRSGRDVGVSLLSSRASCLYILGYPAASRNDAERAVKNARETGQAATLFAPLQHAGFLYTLWGNYAAANALADELIALADERGAPVWKALGTALRGYFFVEGLAIVARPRRQRFSAADFLKRVFDRFAAGERDLVGRALLSAAASLLALFVRSQVTHPFAFEFGRRGRGMCRSISATTAAPRRASCSASATLTAHDGVSTVRHIIDQRSPFDPTSRQPVRPKAIT